jgi:N-acetylneuraminic acid mutarotase
MRSLSTALMVVCAGSAMSCGLSADLAKLTAGNHGGVGASDGGTVGGGNDGGANTQGSCANGVLDSNETDVDCGGPCVPCGQVTGPPYWLPIASLPTTRKAFAVAVGKDGRIYTIGGQTDGGGGWGGGSPQRPLSAVVEVYDPATDHWSTAGSLSQPRALMAASTGRDGRVYAMSGKNSMGLTNLVEVYDPKSNAWTRVSDIPTRRAFFGATTGLDGRLFAVGGDNFERSNALAAFEAYNTDTDQWSMLPPLPTPRTNLGVATLADGRIFAIGGDDNSNLFDAAEVYDPAKNQWSQIARLPVARSGLTAAAAPDGRVWAIGSGARVDVYSPSTNEWASAPNLLHARNTMGSTVGADGRIYVFGGDDAGTAEAYGPKIAVTPNIGAVGSMVTVTGSNFAAHAPVSVYLDSRSSQPIASGTTDDHGTLTAAIWVTLPAVVAGSPHVLVVVDDRSRYPVTAPFTVN